MKRLSTLLASALLTLSFGVGQAAAEESPGGASQDAGQSAASGQKADGDGGAYQSGASNRSFDIRVLSPGSSGDVTQSNTTTGFAIAKNDNDTSQTVDQSQAGGGPGSDSLQIAGQEATSAQHADADATAAQIAPTNEAFSIRVLSPGSSGDVTQSNATTAGAVAANDNDTSQTVDQSQAGAGPGSDSTQIAGQDAANHQDADADAKAVQLHPSNTAVSIRVLSPGDDGDVTQSNDATALGIAKNDNDSHQTIDQSQGTAAPAPAKVTESSKGKDAHPTGSENTQIAGQKADNRQKADADATAAQVKPSNKAVSIRVLSPGKGGDVTQSNDATAIGIAKNDNATSQSIEQSQGSPTPTMLAPEREAPGGYGDKRGGSTGTQVAGQEAGNYQSADADAAAVQIKPSNTAASIRVLSPGKDGDVTQSNDATAIGIAKNDNATRQSIGQTQAGGGYGSGYTQVAGQDAKNGQSADADAFALQVKPTNVNAPVRVLSKGHGGDVTQSNGTTAIAAGLNYNHTRQSIEQIQAGGRGKGAELVQVAGQGSWSRQKADADAVAVQLGASNVNAPVRVGSPNRGHGGSVDQSNDVDAVAVALNRNATRQSLTQRQLGLGSLLLQVAGQGSWTEQRGGAMSLALQGGMHKKKRR